MLRGMSDSMPLVVFQFLSFGPSNGHCNFISKRVEELFGLTSDAVTNDHATLLNAIHEEDRPRLVAVWKTAAETLMPWECEVRRLLPNGEVRWLRGAALPSGEINDDDVMVFGSQIWCGYWMDVTESHQLHEDLMRARITDCP